MPFRPGGCAAALPCGTACSTGRTTMTDSRTRFADVSLGGPDRPPVPEGASAEVAEAVNALYTDGTIGKKGAFSRQWATDMAEDIYVAFHQALARKGGAMGRGP